MTNKLILTIWTNSKGNTIEELKEMGHKILKTKKDRSCIEGDYITYRHCNLTRQLQKGDLVEYTDNYPIRKKRAIIKGTEKDENCIIGCINIKNCVMGIGNVIRVIERQKIPKELFKYL